MTLSAGRLDVYEEKIEDFLKTGEGLEALYDLEGIPRIWLPGLEDGSKTSKGFLKQIYKVIKILQDRAPEGVDVVKWLWDLGLDEYYICNFDKRADYMSAVVDFYGRVSSNFKESDLDNKNLEKMMMVHLINESYAIAYSKIIQATMYHQTWSVNTIMSEIIKYWAMSKNAAFLLSVSGSEDKSLEFVKGAGYDVQLFLLNAAYMGVPQKRERVFFIGRRKDLHLPKLTMNFHEKPILFSEIRDESGVPLKATSKYLGLLKVRKPTDKSISDIYERVYGRSSGFNNTINNDGDVCGTVVSSGMHFRGCDGNKMSAADYVAAQTFPQDYAFGKETPQYVS
jgi:hypothetical protein